MDGLISEMNRVRELITEYESLPKNAGAFGVIMLRQAIKNAEDSLISGDVVEQLQAYRSLKNCE